MKNIVLSLHTVEHLILYNKKVQSLLPEFKELFIKWEFGIRTGLSLLVKQCLVKLIEQLQPCHIELLEQHFGLPINFVKVDSSIVRNRYCTVDEAEQFLNDMIGFQDNISISRCADRLYLCFWR